MFGRKQAAVDIFKIGGEGVGVDAVAVEAAAGGAGSMVWMFKGAPAVDVFMTGGCATGGAGSMIWMFAVAAAAMDF